MSFIVKESFKLISRAKISFILSLISTSISVILIVATLILLLLSDEMESKIKKSISINVFLKENIEKGRTDNIKSEINEKIFVGSVVFISKEEAAENFIKETGEDFRKILDYNPLPASFRVFLKNEYTQPDSIEKIVAVLSEIEGTDEVVYQHQFVNKLLTQLNNIKQYIFIVTAALLLISIYIVYSTLQLIINSKYDELDTMKLVGAKISTIKLPIILNGIIIGLFAGAISLLIFYIIYYYLNPVLNTFGIQSLYKPYYIAVILGIGPLLTILVSVVSLRKISLKI